MANAWLEAMGVPQWQLRQQVAGADAEEEVVIGAKASDEAAEQSQNVERPEPPEPLAQAVADESVVPPTPESIQTVAAPTDLSVSYKQIPLLVIWDEQHENAVAGAGSMPSGELGDLLANIVIAVGLTEDVVEAWPLAVDDIATALHQKALQPRCVWHFAAGQLAQQSSLKVPELQKSITLVKAPALGELQAQKPLKAELWKLLKVLKADGLWL